jgi:hypothetical protein
MATASKLEGNARLKRVDLVIAKDENADAMLAEKASVLLGYNGAMVRKNVAGVLGKILIDLDIRPYDVKRVSAYKEKKRKEAHAERRAAVRSSYVTVTSRWSLVPIAKYTQIVPEFVLRKAVQIKEACPEVTIYVDALKVNTKRIPDPFLVVSLGKEKYWVEVWDEAEFEATLVDE